MGENNLNPVRNAMTSPQIRDAATLILIDRSSGYHRVLMGRRHKKHNFMAGLYVFPGGGTDTSDIRIDVASPLHPEDEKKLCASGISPELAQAIALSAIRETYEESGLLIGRNQPFNAPVPAWQAFSSLNIQPSLEHLRYIGRAITPPRQIRRYDTRFFAAWRETVAHELLTPPTNELEDLAWVSIRETFEMDLPDITRRLLLDLEKRLRLDPELLPGGQVTSYSMHENKLKMTIV